MPKLQPMRKTSTDRPCYKHSLMQQWMRHNCGNTC